MKKQTSNISLSHNYTSQAYTKAKKPQQMLHCILMRIVKNNNKKVQTKTYYVAYTTHQVQVQTLTIVIVLP